MSHDERCRSRSLPPVDSRFHRMLVWVLLCLWLTMAALIEEPATSNRAVTFLLLGIVLMASRHLRPGAGSSAASRVLIVLAMLYGYDAARGWSVTIGLGSLRELTFYPAVLILGAGAFFGTILVVRTHSDAIGARGKRLRPVLHHPAFLVGVLVAVVGVVVWLVLRSSYPIEGVGLFRNLGHSILELTLVLVLAAGLVAKTAGAATAARAFGTSCIVAGAILLARTAM